MRKSVLVNSLLQKELRKNETVVCYFFFGRDVPRQSNALSAMCAILHQLFNQNEPLLVYAVRDFLQIGGALSQSFRRIWDILIRAALDASSGEIICVLDALDECERAGCERLIQLMTEYYRNATSDQLTACKLKFLITSRRYTYLERQFRQLDKSVETIHTSGSAFITAEINQFIKNEVKNVVRDLGWEDSMRRTLEERLAKVENRTYLWVHLMIDEIKQSEGVTAFRFPRATFYEVARFRSRTHTDRCAQETKQWDSTRASHNSEAQHSY